MPRLQQSSGKVARKSFTETFGKSLDFALLVCAGCAGLKFAKRALAKGAKVPSGVSCNLSQLLTFDCLELYPTNCTRF